MNADSSSTLPYQLLLLPLLLRGLTAAGTLLHALLPSSVSGVITLLSPAIYSCVFRDPTKHQMTHLLLNWLMAAQTSCLSLQSSF